MWKCQICGHAYQGNLHSFYSFDRGGCCVLLGDRPIRSGTNLAHFRWALRYDTMECIARCNRSCWFAVFVAFCYWAWRSRIVSRRCPRNPRVFDWCVSIQPFAKLMLKTVTSVTAQYPATLFVGVVGLIIQSGYGALWIATLVGLFQHFENQRSSNGVRYVTVVFMVS